MFNVDLSKVDLERVLPNRAYEFLAAFAPGLFFIFSVLLANPDLVARAVGGAQHQFSIDRYAALAIGSFLAFIVGNGFMLVCSIILWLFGFLYQFKIFVWRRLCKWPVLQITEWLMKKPSWRGPELAKFHDRIATIAHYGFGNWRGIQGCWLVLARRLLKVRYGVNANELKEEEWAALFPSLGTLAPEDVRGKLYMVASHATGWAGFAATRFAPALRNKYYVVFCLFLILQGFLHDYYVVQRRYDPRAAGLANIRAVLREFPEPTPESKPEVNPREPAPEES
jgi:hypothetical protein